MREEPVEAGDPILDDSEALADRFARTAAFSWLALPLGFYALWLLYLVFCARGQMTVRARRAVAKGVVILALEYAGPMAATLGFWLRRS